MKVARTVLRGC